MRGSAFETTELQERMDVFEKQLASYFPPSVRRNGREISNDMRVDIEEVHENFINAYVYGSGNDPYRVTMWLVDVAATRMCCTCPRFADGHLCKHLYAVIAEMDEFLAEYDLKSIPSQMLSLGRPVHWSGNDDDLSPADVVEPAIPVWKQTLSSLVAESQAADPRTPTIRTQTIGPAAECRVVLDAGKSTGCKTLAFRFQHRERNKKGRFGKWKTFLLDVSKLESFDEQTRNALQELTARNEATVARPVVRYDYSWDQGSHYRSEYEFIALRQRAVLPVLKSIAKRDQLLWALSETDVNPQQLTWDDAETPWRFEVDVEVDGDDRVLTGLFRRNDAETSEPVELQLGSVIAAVPGLAMIVPGGDDQPSWITPLEETSPLWLRLFLKNPQLNVPEADREEFLKTIAQTDPLPDGKRPEGWDIEIPLETPRPLVRLWRPTENTRCKSLLAKLVFVYPSREVNQIDSAHVIETDDAIFRRDLDAEQDWLVQLIGSPGIDLEAYHLVQADPEAVAAVSPADLPKFVEYLTANDWAVEADGKSLKAGGRYSMTVDGRQETGIDWFDLNGEASFGEATAGIPALLAAINRGQDYVLLDDGSHGLLPEDWIQKFKPLAGMATSDNPDQVTFRSSQALLLDAMLAEHDVQIDFAETYLRIRDRIASAANPKPKGRPPGFRGTLRDYQKQGVGWLSFLRELELCGCLADDMGLGKTIQVLAHLEHVRRSLAKPAQSDSAESDHAQSDNGSATDRRLCLAVVPKSLIFNWIDEAARFTPKMRVAAFHGTDRKQLLEQLDDIDLLVTTYGTMRIDIESLKNIPFDTVVLDESQAIKNGQSLAAKASRLLDARHRIAMTGTPVENHLGELWSLFEFLNPGMLGRSSVFKDAVKQSKPSSNGSSNNGTGFDAVKTLGTAIRPFLLRRTKDAVLTELPPKVEQQIYVELSKSDRKAYNDLAAHYRAQLDETFAAQGFQKSQIVVLEALLRLRQAACHPGLLDPKKRTKKAGKISVLLEQIEEVVASGHKALVFSQFVKLLDIARHHLDKAKIPYEYLDGKTNDRRTPVQRFQNDPDIPLFLISLKAGGHGLNLTAADHVFILDPWWNPAVEAQAVDRAHRMGQERPVVAARLIAKDTVEEKIELLKESKRKLAEALVSNESAVPRGLTEDDVRLLLS